ncbi:MAG: hypothetical protein MSS85_07590 [Pyramidobacter sp.]|uniref:hypothetical protein n=1 Tax=Pyramidobacter sp. TaxID=1943581 RepID=UPI0025EC1FD6|nr:hypothetical protein [Pyramidobacter sp.]MCI7403932.1 hypothetical protein [Pyramidobacter sp.]
MSAKSLWHYPAEGDYPPTDESVLVQAADMDEWAKAVVKKSDRTALGMVQQSARYKGKDPGLGIDLWEGVPMHSAVTAWRAHGASPDLDRVKSAIVKFQTEMTRDDNQLAVLLASSYRVDPRKNRDYLLGLIKKFRQNGKEANGNSLLNHEAHSKEPPVFIDGAGVSYTVENRYGHGVIVQIDMPGAAARYASDFPQARRIYPDETAAAVALIAEAERQGWKRCSAAA